MTQTAQPIRPMVLDACVLIDYLKSDRSVLTVMTEHIGPIHVVSTMVEEIKTINHQDELLEIGLIIIEPNIDDIFAAASLTSGPLSFHDRVCFFTAKRYGFICVTNDGCLRRECEKYNISLLWGLELLTELCRCGGLPVQNAADIAKLMHLNSPRYITQDIFQRFLKAIHGI